MTTHFDLLAYTEGKEEPTTIGSPHASWQEARDAAVPFMQAMRRCLREHAVDRIAVREVSVFEVEIDIPPAEPEPEALAV